MYRIKKFSDVTDYVARLIKNGVNPGDILICCDWDDTINADGAWHRCPKEHRKNCTQEFFHFPSGRTIYEHEVDSKLRDPDIQEQLARIREMGVKIIITSARPPLSDLFILESNNPRLSLDFRQEDGSIDYDRIKTGIRDYLKGLSDNDILRRARDKVFSMIDLSRLDFRSDDYCLIVRPSETRSGEFIVYYEGYGFVGHDKQYNINLLLLRLDFTPGHLIIVDDSEKVINDFWQGPKRPGMSIHLLHYP